MCSKVRNFDVEHNYGNVLVQLFSLQANAGSVICYREKHALTFDVFVQLLTLDWLKSLENQQRSASQVFSSL